MSNPLTTSHTVLGELVVDAKKPLEFEVTEQDVKTGKALKSRECPGNHGVCRAVKAVHPSLTNSEVRVHLSRTYVRVPSQIARKEFGATEVPCDAAHVWLRFTNSQSLSDQVYKMDRQQDFTPGEYKLGPVEHKPSKPRAKRTAKPAAKPRTRVARRPSKRRELIGVRKFGINR